MHKPIVLLSAFLLAGTAGAENPADTNAGPSVVITNSTDDTGSSKSCQEENKRSKKSRYGELRRLKFMEKELDRIGVSEEEREQIVALQQMYKEKMAANAEEIATAREKLTALLDQGASMELIEAAIEEVSEAQTRQLRILVMNRIEMERILGQEKHDEFMKNARQQYQKHGRRGGPPFPKRSSEPPGPPTAADN